MERHVRWLWFLSADACDCLALHILQDVEQISILTYLGEFFVQSVEALEKCIRNGFKTLIKSFGGF